MEAYFASPSSFRYWSSGSPFYFAFQGDGGRRLEDGGREILQQGQPVPGALSVFS